MTPLRIRAELVNGFVQRNPWSPTLDGVLAAAAMLERLGPDEYAIQAATPSMHQSVEGLPLEVWRDGEAWWYIASSPEPIGEVGREKRWRHRRFDDQHERFLPEKTGRVLTAGGPYKATRLSDTRVICRAVEWHAIGDAGEVRRLLSGVLQLGARRGAGAGEVAEWIVTEDGDVDRAARLRPLPVDHAAKIGVAGPIMSWSLVPPATGRKWDCVMPVIDAA